MVPDEDITVAACWVADAAAGRMASGLASMIGKPTWQRTAFFLNTATAWQNVLSVGAIAIMVLAVYEPPSSLDANCFRPGAPTCGLLPWQLLVEAVVLGCFWLDIASKVAYMGRDRWWDKGWHQLYLGAVAFLSVDLLIALAVGQHPFRLLRPALLGLRNREQRHTATALFYLLSRHFGVALFGMVLLVLFTAALGVQLFGDSYETEEGAYAGAFDSVGAAALQIWVLVSSAENFPGVALL